MTTLRTRSAFRMLAVIALCAPLTACEEKKSVGRPVNATTGAAYPATVAVARTGPAEHMPNQPPPPAEPPQTENYQHFVENAYVLAAREPRSTFSASVDTAAYSILRSKINGGQLPPKEAVRIADLLNYFDYDYPKPQGTAPVAATLELAPCPWQPKHHLLRIALAARKFAPGEMPARNLVFLIDTSGSMDEPNKLPLVKQSLNFLIETLRPEDRVSIVTYAGDASLRLEPTPGTQKGRIRAAVEGLSARGSTNGGGGIEMAYAEAARSFIEGGVNRVVLATDGDFNVGISSEGALVRLVEEKRKTGVYLTVLGFGMGNLQDAKLEQLAQHGNGHYAYIDDAGEARKVFAEQGGSLAVVAKDVKLQVEFNHTMVAAYRLIGYENRVLKNEDFRNDARDAGDMGSGHTVTALYEIVPTGVEVPAQDSGDLKYQWPPKDTKAAQSGEWLTFRMRYKDPDSEAPTELAFPVGKDGLRKTGSADFRFAAAVTAFGLLLRDSEYKGTASWADVREWAVDTVGPDRRGYRRDFVELVNKVVRLTKGAD